MKLKNKLIFILIAMVFVPLIFAEQKPVDPVNWRELVKFLPKLDGWTMKGEPEGNTVKMDTFKFSEASAHYEQGPQRVGIKIMDGAFIPGVYMGIRTMMQMEIDSSDRLVKKITIRDCPGVEEIKFKNKRAKLLILVSDRFLIEIEGSKFDDSSALKKIAEAIDFNGVKALVK